jgi:chromate transporter
MKTSSTTESQAPAPVSLATIVREWGRIGCIGFGGPPAHIALFRALCVTRRRWLSEEQFERAIAATNLLPGPASTQLAIYCAWRLRGTRGALVGGSCFIVPGLVAILALSVLFLGGSPPLWVRGAGMGAGAAVAAVAVSAGLGVALPIWRRATGPRHVRVVAYALFGGAGAALIGPWLVLVLLGCGAIELAARGVGSVRAAAAHAWPVLVALAGAGGIGSLCWTALKVGALSFGGGFVIIPLMQSDAVSTYHWMTHAQFLNAVALGQVTPGPVTQTVAAVGYSAGGIGAGLLAALVAFAPSFSFILFGAERFERLLASERVIAFLAGAAPAAAGAIIGSAIPLGSSLSENWQYVVLGVAAVLLLVLRRGVVPTLVLAGVAGTAVALAGGPIVG